MTKAINKYEVFPKLSKGLFNYYFFYWFFNDWLTALTDIFLRYNFVRLFYIENLFNSIYLLVLNMIFMTLGERRVSKVLISIFEIFFEEGKNGGSSPPHSHLWLTSYVTSFLSFVDLRLGQSSCSTCSLYISFYLNFVLYG